MSFRVIVEIGNPPRAEHVPLPRFVLSRMEHTSVTPPRAEHVPLPRFVSSQM